MSQVFLSDADLIGFVPTLDVDLLDFNDDTDCLVTFSDVTSSVQEVVVPVVEVLDTEEAEEAVEIQHRLAA